MSNISEPVLEMGRRLEDEELSSYEKNDMVFLIYFGIHPSIVLSPKKINRSEDYSSCRWMTQQETQYLCDIINTRYEKEHMSHLHQRMVDQRNTWTEFFKKY